jgi:hypothetical protein
LRSANPAERLAAALLIPGVMAKRMRLLDDRQIGQLLEDEVWSQLNLLAPEATICMEAAGAASRTREGYTGAQAIRDSTQDEPVVCGSTG